MDFKVVGVFPNTEAQGGPKFPNQPSHLVGSFWDGSSFNANAARWVGLRDPTTMNTEFVANYRRIKVSKPINDIFCPFKGL